MVGSMRERLLGIITSIVVHSCVVSLLVAASFAVQDGPVKVVEVDFSLVRDESRDYSVTEVKKGAPKRSPGNAGGGTVSKRKAEAPRRSQRSPETLPVKGEAEASSVSTIVTVSDSSSEAAVDGVAGSYSDLSGTAGSSGSRGGSGAGGGSGGPAGGSGGGHSGHGGGLGGGRGAGFGPGEGLVEGGRDYSYIRDAVMRNIEYPDEAIRLGIEGRVLISFIVLENGTTSKIRVVAGSGSRLLDDSARKAVAITRINRRVPYRVVVHLPITYKLQG
jgi:TonB family protein